MFILMIAICLNDITFDCHIHNTYHIEHNLKISIVYKFNVLIEVKEIITECFATKIFNVSKDLSDQ